MKLATGNQISWFRSAGGTGPVEYFGERGTIRRIAPHAVLAELPDGSRKWVDKDRVICLLAPKKGGFQ